MLEKLQRMWNRLLSLVDMAKNQVKLTSECVSTLNSAQQSSGRKAREFTKTEIDKMLRMCVIEPEQAEWA